jgi:hypothetical protein
MVTLLRRRQDEVRHYAYTVNANVTVLDNPSSGSEILPYCKWFPKSACGFFSFLFNECTFFSWSPKILSFSAWRSVLKVFDMEILYFLSALIFNASFRVKYHFCL